MSWDDKDFPALHEQVGRVCAAWSFLEVVTEAAIWGLLDIDDRLAPLVTWNKDMESRGKLIAERGELKHPEETEMLKTFNSKLRTVIHDRNIVIHGIIHIRVQMRPPCWTIFRGVGKGKNFPVSVEAAEIVRKNIDKIADDLGSFNSRHAYTRTNKHTDEIEPSWPKPL